MIDLSAHMVMRYAVLLVTIISVLFSIKARKMLVGEQKELFDRCLGCMGLFLMAILVHAIREDIWDADLLRVPEHLLFLLGFICAFNTSLYVMNKKEEWGLQGV